MVYTQKYWSYIMLVNINVVTNLVYLCELYKYKATTQLRQLLKVKAMIIYKFCNIELRTKKINEDIFAWFWDSFYIRIKPYALYYAIIKHIFIYT